MKNQADLYPADKKERSSCFPQRLRLLHLICTLWFNFTCTLSLAQIVDTNAEREQYDFRGVSHYFGLVL